MHHISGREHISDYSLHPYIFSLQTSLPGSGGRRWMEPLKSRYKTSSELQTQQLQPHQETTYSRTRNASEKNKYTPGVLIQSYINKMLWWARFMYVYTSSSRSQHSMKRIHTYTASRPENYIHPPKLFEAGSAPRKLSSNLEQINIWKQEYSDRYR